MHFILIYFSKILVIFLYAFMLSCGLSMSYHSSGNCDFNLNRPVIELKFSSAQVATTADAGMAAGNQTRLSIYGARAQGYSPLQSNQWFLLEAEI